MGGFTSFSSVNVISKTGGTKGKASIQFGFEPTALPLDLMFEEDRKEDCITQGWKDVLRYTSVNSKLGNTRNRGKRTEKLNAPNKPPNKRGQCSKAFRKKNSLTLFNPQANKGDLSLQQMVKGQWLFSDVKCFSKVQHQDQGHRQKPVLEPPLFYIITVNKEPGIPQITLTKTE